MAVLAPKQRRLHALLLSTFVCLFTTSAFAEEAQWIWATGSTLQDPVAKDQQCLFRKSINVRVRSEAQFEIIADDEYELYVNGYRIGTGGSIKRVDEYDVSEFLQIGRNIVAVKVTNRTGKHAALAARISVSPIDNEGWFTFNTDSTWKTSTTPSDLWETVLFNDRSWGRASSFGRFGETAPFDQTQEEVTSAPEQKERFQIQRGFGVQRVLTDEKVGSVIAMTFNEFGHILVSQENGPLLLVFDKDEDGVPETVRTYCDQVKSCQGILALNGQVFVTGIGPDGPALYRCSDRDRNGTLETVKSIVKFKGSAGEHGAHGLQLGPDGMIYAVLGSHVQAVGVKGDGQTYNGSYEGDLVARYEDPNGHAMGIKAPGGTVIRTNAEGSVVETVAGGLRNAYDLVFHGSGSMFVHDSDMEADVNTPWYRPNTLFDVAEGGEFGWRSGWSKWPDYYVDRLPNLLETGRGSPTGGVCYEHYMFPVRYQNTLFLADWSEGQILNVKLKQRGAGFVADSEVFLKGNPLNVTDIEVGPDGALYFCTGGRGTMGGVYRVVYKGDVPDRMKNIGTGIARAIRQPQLRSAWARQEIASIKRELGDEWAQLVAGVAYSNDNPAAYRLQAMDLMQLFGPVPSEDFVVELSQVPNEKVRARAASLMGYHPGSIGASRLVEMLEDDNLYVRRSACEALLRSGARPKDPEVLLNLLAEEDRTLVFLARRILEQVPDIKWRREVLTSPDTRVSLVGMLGLVNADPSDRTGLLVLERISEMMTDFLSDADFVDALRVSQVALHRCDIDPDRIVQFRNQVAEEFPAGEVRINHELIRLAAHMDAKSIADRGIDFLSSNASTEEKTWVAMHLQLLSHQWTAENRFKLLRHFEQVASETTEGALPLYISDVTRDFAKTFSTDDVQAVLEQGNAWRNAALACIYKLKTPIDATTTQTLMGLDQQIVENPRVGDVQRRLRTGIIAMLATSKSPEASAYLRELWRKEPERRSLLAMALSAKPEGENWDYLVRSLNILDADAVGDVVGALRSVRVATDDPMALRDLILLGVRVHETEQSFENIERLLEHWTGMKRPVKSAANMKPWQKWYAKTFPDRTPAVPPPAEESSWDFNQLVEYLESERGGMGDPIDGRVAFTKAQCNNCHQFGNYGNAIGPNLSGISSRFTKREIVESILYPGHVVSDQYASKKVLTNDGAIYTGLVGKKSDGSVSIRDARNKVTIVDRKEIDQILPHRSSIMPSGLIDELTLREISDMMSYMGVVTPIQVATRPEE